MGTIGRALAVVSSADFNVVAWALCRRLFRCDWLDGRYCRRLSRCDWLDGGYCRRLSKCDWLDGG